VLGALFALDRVTPDALARLAVLVAASCCLVAHVFSLNDWAGIAADGNDPHKAGTVFLTRGVSRQSIGILSLLLLGASLVLFALLDARTLAIGATIAALGIVYSHPAVDAKGTPLLASAPHVLGGVLHFLLGYSLFGPIDGRVVLIAIYFALTFTAGHLNLEVRDYEGDCLNGIRTSAVRFGRVPVFLASVAIFTAAYAYLGVLAARGLVPAAQATALLLYPVQAAWSVAALRAGLTFEAMSRLQARYRLLFAVIGILMLATLLARSQCPW
jgi:4-hydroxybenzoate polyprenyltransferase